jgi:hypothetical protein
MRKQLRGQFTMPDVLSSGQQLASRGVVQVQGARRPGGQMQQAVVQAMLWGRGSKKTRERRERKRRRKRMLRRVQKGRKMKRGTVVRYLQRKKQLLSNHVWLLCSSLGSVP